MFFISAKSKYTHSKISKINQIVLLYEPSKKKRGSTQNKKYSPGRGIVHSNVGYISSSKLFLNVIFPTRHEKQFKYIFGGRYVENCLGIILRNRDAQNIDVILI